VSGQSYFPRAALRLIMRLDEFGNAAPLRRASPAATTKNLNGVGANRAGMTAQPDPNAPPGVSRLVIAPAAGATTGGGGPQARARSSDGLTWDVACIPKDVEWRQNGLRKAATLDATLKFIDLPLDARLLRSVGVELLLGCVDAETAALEAGGDWAGQGAPIIPRTYTGPRGEARTNVRFQGFVDEWEADWSDKEPLVHLRCTDNTQLLIDQEHPPRLVLDMTKPLDLSVAGYLANFPQFQGLTVEYRPAGDAPPVLKSVLSGTAYRPNLGPQQSKGGNASGSTKASVLDYLTEVVGSVGHSIRMDGTNLVIQRVRSILTNSTVGRPDDPYAGRTVDGTQYPSRTFIYGRNLRSMKPKRDFRRHPASGVECRCYLPEKKKLLVARYPKVSADPATQKVQIHALPGDGAADQKWTVIHVAGISDQPTLNRLAQDYYESLGRQELGVEVETMNLASFGGDNTDPDVLDMKFGDTFALAVNRSSDEGNALNAIEQALTMGQRAQRFMEGLGFDPGFAAAVAAASTNAGFQYNFRMHTMSVGWSGEAGCKLGVGGVNYVEVRADNVLPPGQEPGNTALPQQDIPAGDALPG
jgi:hypothetical protein